MRRFQSRQYLLAATAAVSTQLFATSAFAGGDGAGEEHGFHIEPFFWGQLINFILLAFLFWKFALPALNKFFAERRNTIAKDLEEATRLRQEAEASFSEYEEKLGQLDTELASLRTDVIKAGELERDRIVQEAEGKAARLRKDSQFIVEQRGKQLRLDLRRNAAESTIAAAREAIAARLTPEDHRRLAEEFLGELGTQASSPTQQTSAGTSSPRGVV